MKTFILLLFVAFAHGQVQNLCGPAPGSGFKFVDDPSDCISYLWCNFNNTGSLSSVHQGGCPTGFNFDEANMACSGSFSCTLKCEFNTGVTRVAVPADTECRTYVACTDTAIGADEIICPTGSVFNRNFGSCTTPRIAPCEGSSGGGGGDPSPDCAGDEDFFNNEERCSGFYTCVEGDLVDDDCPNDLHWDPKLGFCNDPEYLDPICDDSVRRAKAPKLEIPKPPLIDIEAGMRRRMLIMAAKKRSQL